MATILDNEKVRVWDFSKSAHVYDIETGWDKITEIGFSKNGYLYIADRCERVEKDVFTKRFVILIEKQRVVVWDTEKQLFGVEYAHRVEAKELAREAKVFERIYNEPFTSFVIADDELEIGFYPGKKEWTRLGNNQACWAGISTTGDGSVNTGYIQIVSIMCGNVLNPSTYNGLSGKKYPHQIPYWNVGSKTTIVTWNLASKSTNNNPKMLDYFEAKITTRIQISMLSFYSDPNHFIDCPLCGFKFSLPTLVLETIKEISKKGRNNLKQSSYLELPEELWENPRLFEKCPECHEMIKFNPFFGSHLKILIDYFSFEHREQKYQEKLKLAEDAFDIENWKVAYNLYLKLTQQGMFDINYLRFKMAVCQLNRLISENRDLIADINNLTNLLHEKGAIDKAQSISCKLKERLDNIKKEDTLKKNAVAPWWKKIF